MSHAKSNAGYEQFQNVPDVNVPPQHNGQQHGTPQYTPQVMVQQTQIVQTGVQAATFTTDMPYPRWSWCNLITAMFSVLCCWGFGVIAMVMALLSYTDHKSKDYQRSRSKRNIAWILSILAIVIGSLLTVVIIAVYFKVIRDSQMTYENEFNHN